MKSHFLLLIIVIVFLFNPVHGLFASHSMQDYIDSFVDAAKFKMEETISLNDSALAQIWSYFKENYGRMYSSIEEEKQRLRVFRDHLKFILESNFARFRSYELEVNEFADWTEEEFDNWKKGLLVPHTIRRRRLHLYKNLFYRRMQRKRFFRDWFSGLFHRNKPSQHPTDLFDWRTKNVVSAVKNQLKCGCCYAFSTASILETLYALKRNTTNVVEFSAQQITDCSSGGNNGCKGGHFAPSIRYILDRGGKIATAASYPYAGKRQTCRNDGFDEVHLGQIEYVALAEGDEKAMLEALTNYSPLFIGVDAETRSFMFYRKGILKIDHCPSRRQDMDHAMVVVGHGYDSGLQTAYWIIRNTWGTKWGESGYLRLAKDAGNMCGVASMAHYAKLV